MDSYVLLDIRGLALRSLHSGVDKDADTDSLTGRSVNTPGHAIENLITDYLQPILSGYRVKQLVAIWDGGNFYRETLYPEYKANRRKIEQSPELKSAIDETIKNTKLLLKYMGITQVMVDNVEADDVIAWMAENLPNSLIYSVDRDLIQLGADNVALNIGREFVESFKDKDNDVPCRRVALYKSLVGDTSDGYKGVKGFGPAKWAQLVETYGDDGLQQLEDMLNGGGFALLQNLADSGTEPLLELVSKDVKGWVLSWKLANLAPELVNKRVKINRGSGEKTMFQTPKWSVAVPRTDRLNDLLLSLGSQHLREVLAPYMPNPAFILDASVLDDESATLADAAQLFAESPFVSIDWETSAPINDNFKEAAKGREYVDMLSSRITGAGFTFGKNLEHTFYATFDHADSNNLPVEFLTKLIDCIPASVPKVAQNFYFERTIYKNQFGKELTFLHDTKIMGSHYDEQETNGLKDMSLRYLGYKQLHYGDVIEKGKAMRDYSAEHVFKYGADDPIVTAHLYEFLKLQLLLEGTWDFVRTKEFPPIYMLSDAYLAGVDIDWDELENLRVADANIYTDNMARLRELLRENQTPEFLQKGIDNLLDVEREITDGKAKQKVEAKEMTKEEASEWVAKEVASLRLKVEDRVTYKDLTKVEKEIEFSPTPKQFSEVAEYLGLPPIEDKTKKAWEAWHKEAVAHISNPRAQTLHERVGSSTGNLHLSTEASKTMPGRESLVRFCTEIKRELTPDEKRYRTEGSELSLGSPAQMKALLYGMLALPLRIRNFDVNEERDDLGLEGSPQANEDAILTAMATDAPEGSWLREALECLLAAKKAHTRNSNFYSKYPLWKHPISGLIHPQLNSCGTETRRMSGSSPNLMQMPKRGEGIKFRSAVIPLKGHDLICSIDWAGEELRVGAGLSRDIEMLSCYIDGEVLRTLPEWMITQLGPEFVKRFQSSTLRDIHSLTAAGIAELPYDEFERIRHDDTHKDAKRLKKIRGDAKGVNFLSQYGGGPTKLARKLICDPKVAEDYLSAKKKLYNGYESWRTDSIEKLHDQGYLTTLFGSRRHLFSKLLTSDKGMKGYLERSALNSLIQGVCADYLKVVLSDLHHRQTFQRHGAQFLAPIHDELVFSCHSSQAASLILEVHEIMTQGIPGLPCPLWAEPSLGPNFGTQIEIGPHPTADLINQAISKALDLREAA